MEESYKSIVADQFQIFDNMFEGISVYKLIFNDKDEVIDGILEYMNPATVETMGMNPEDVIGKTAVELFSLEFIKPHLNAVNELHLTGKKNRFEVYYAPTNKYFLVSGFDMSDNLFAVLRVDITEQKKSQDALRQSKEIYHSLFKNNHAVMLLINPETGDIVDANPAACSFYGYSKLKITKLKITDINVLNEQEVLNEIHKSELGKRKYFIFKHKLSNGEIKDVEVYSGPIIVKNRKLIYSIVHDITERKKAEEELRKAHIHLEEQVEKRTKELENAYKELEEREERFSSLVSASSEVLYRVSPDWSEMRQLNSPGFLANTLKPNPNWLQDYIPLKDQPRVAAAFNEAIRTKSVYELEHRVIQADGGVGWTFSRAIPIINEKGEIIEWFGTASDITKRKEAEKELKQTIDELKRSNDELESFAFITSHDLQEPLRTIASYAQLIERRYKGKLDKDADEFIDFMVDGAKRMKEMIQGLLDYSRVGTRGHEFTEFGAETALNYALSNLGSAIGEVNAEVTYDSLPLIFADEDQIIRVFQNLIGNALKFRREEVKPKIHISARKEDNESVFSVSDNGIGLEEQYSDKIFEVFKRLHAIGEYQGAGIGLAIVKRIIDRHGGKIWVESKPGRGSTFYFTLS